jgi:hypothetical protein
MAASFDISRDVLHVARQVADLMVVIQQPGFFRTFFAVTQQFHEVLLFK